MTKLDLVDLSEDPFTSLKASVERDRTNAIRKAGERGLLAHDAIYNYWAGQVAMADLVLSYIEAEERDL